MANGTLKIRAEQEEPGAAELRRRAGDGDAPELDVLFSAMAEVKASDMHLASGKPPMLRVDGEMRKLDWIFLTEAEIQAMLEGVLPDLNRQEFEASNDTDFAITLPDESRLRVNLFRDRHGLGAVFRSIPAQVCSLAELGMPRIVEDICKLNKGLVVVTGPTGSGKSTTLAAMMDHINATRREHLITVEDPIEFVHQDKLCRVNQREVHTHTRSFASALRAALREDPDVVLVGEMRDLETIEIALETAETGHLVFGTLHTNTAVGTVNRIIDAFPSNQQNQIRTILASSLKAAIAQTLCRRLDKGRVAALEVLVVDNGVASMIRENKVHQIPSAMQAGGAHGMISLNDSLAELVGSGQVALEEAHRKAVDRDDLLSKLARRGFAPPEAAAPSLTPPAHPPQPTPASPPRLPERESVFRDIFGCRCQPRKEDDQVAAASPGAGRGHA